MDHQKPYLELILGFLGFSQVDAVVVEPTLASPEDVAATEAAAIESAKKLARDWR
jgi:FMN-dependent NADH-azoreductase